MSSPAVASGGVGMAAFPESSFPPNGGREVSTIPLFLQGGQGLFNALAPSQALLGMLIEWDHGLGDVHSLIH